MSLSVTRVAAALGVAAAALLGGASPALAGHLQGGSIYAEVTSTGRLQGTLTYAAVAACTVGQQSSQSITVTAPTNQTASVSVPMLATRCITGSATYKGEFDVPLDTSTFAGGAPDGVYSAYWMDCCRIGGIINAGASSGNVRYETQVRKTAMQASAAPKFGSNVANGIGIGADYVQNLNASDPDGTAVSYQTLVTPTDPDAPDLRHRHALAERARVHPRRDDGRLHRRSALRLQGPGDRRPGRVRRARRAAQGRLDQPPAGHHRPRCELLGRRRRPGHHPVHGHRSQRR